MKVTVIVPVYNAKFYIGDCIDSILKQTYEDIEVIIIDDGSTDGTNHQLSFYAQKDSRIKVIYKKNEGQSLARNKGLELADGDYIYFADADDTLPKDAIESLMQITIIKQYDIVCGSYYRVEGNGHEKVIHLRTTSGEVARKGNLEANKRYHSIKTKSVFGYIWGKIYKRTFLMEHKILFDDIRKIYMEDTLFNLKAFSKNPSYYFLNYPVYRYHIRSNSTTRRYERILEDKMISMLELYKNYLMKNQCYRSNYDLYLPLIMRVFCWSIIKNIQYSGLSYRHIYRTIRIFGENKTIREAVGERKAIAALKKIDSHAEQLFFIFCMLGVRNRWYPLLSALFYIIYPFNLLYVKLYVK